MLSQIVKNLNIARSGVYFLESLPFAFFSRVLVHPDLPPPTQEQISALWKNIIALHEADRENMDAGIYPWRAVEIENPWRHARSFLGVLSDGVRVAWRMRRGKTKDLPADAAEGMPEYYARNFHFQTDGYFSEASARRYDHQVEILFSGTAGAMRRMLLPVLAEGVTGRWLEIGCGAGSATRAVLETFPRAHVTAVDLSEAYLKVAQDNLRNYPHVDFVQANGTDLPFKDESFETVYSVYMLHELPRDVRSKVVREAYRILKPGGLLLFADSLQMGDTPEMDWALERFPKVYHEPFYKDYVRDRLEDLLARSCVHGSSSHAVSGSDATLGKPETRIGFLTKMAWLRKPLES